MLHYFQIILEGCVCLHSTDVYLYSSISVIPFLFWELLGSILQRLQILVETPKKFKYL